MKKHELKKIFFCQNLGYVKSSRPKLLRSSRPAVLKDFGNFQGKYSMFNLLVKLKKIDC